MKTATLLSIACLSSSTLLVDAHGYGPAGSISLLEREARAIEERSWGRYRAGSRYALHRRSDGTTPDTVKLDPSIPQMSPLPPVDGATITKSIQQTIKNDVDTVLKEFKNLPQYVKDMLKSAFNNVFNQVQYTQSPQEQFNTIQTAITTKLSQIENSIPTTFYQLLGDQTNDQGNVAALKTCVMQIVASTTPDAQDMPTSCLTQSGLSVPSLVDQFNAFVDMNDFVAPVTAQNAVAQQITDFLTSSNLAPSQQALIAAANEAIKNVVATVSAKERDAAQASFKCWLDALNMIAGTTFEQRNLKCNQGALTGSSATKGSPLQNIEEAYTAMVDQYSGVLPATLVTNIQAIGKTALSLNLGAYDSAVRDTINDAILSNVAMTGGTTATVVGDMIKCLNTIYDDTPANDCNPNQNGEILQLNTNIYYNYLDQYVSILPKRLVEELKASILADLQSKNQVPPAELEQQLQSLFDTASLGSVYDDCVREFKQCIINGITNGAANTACTGTIGDKCGTLPPLTPGLPAGGANPYGDIGNNLRNRVRSANAASEKRHLAQAVRPAARHLQAAAKTKRQGAQVANRTIVVGRSYGEEVAYALVGQSSAYASAVGQKCSWLSTGLNGGVSSNVWTAQLASALLPHVIA